jgi:hypothetical protein
MSIVTKCVKDRKHITSADNLLAEPVPIFLYGTGPVMAALSDKVTWISDNIKRPDAKKAYLDHSEYFWGYDYIYSLVSEVQFGNAIYDAWTELLNLKVSS